MANSYREYLKIKKYGGEGGGTPSPTLISKTINANGVYLPEDDQADGYNSVAVNVPEVSDIAFVPPQKFKSNGSALQDYKIFGSDGTKTDNKTAVLPLTFSTVENKLRDWTIYGNNNVGKNLFNEVYPNITGTVKYISLYVGSGEFTLSTTAGRTDTNTTVLFLLAGNVSSGASSSANGVANDQSRTVTAVDGYVTIGYRGYTYITPVDENTMLNAGSTAEPYEPYQQGVGQRTKNLLKITAETQTINDVTYTVDKAAGTITANGTASKLTILDIATIFSSYGDFYLSGCAAGGGTNTYAIYAYDATTSARAKKWNGVDASNFVKNDTASEEVQLVQGNTSVIRLCIQNEIVCNNLVFKPMLRLPDTSADFDPYGYKIPLSVNSTPQTFYIGDSPLTAGQSISKTSTGVDIATTEGENTISTTLYNKPETFIEYVNQIGVGDEVSGSYRIPVTINSTTTNVPIGDTPLIEDEYVSYAEQKIYKYVDGVLTPVDPPSALPQISTANGVNELSIDTDVQPDLVQIGLGIPVELIPTALGTKTITANDTYDASDDNLDGYSSVTVNVSMANRIALEEGALPLTFTTNQNHLFNYRIYGKTSTDVAPNIYNSSFKKGAYNINTGSYDSSYTAYLCSNVKAPVSANTKYIAKCTSTYSMTLTVNYYDSTGTHLSHSNDGEFSNILTFTTPADCAFINVNLNASDSSVQPSSVSSFTLQQSETNELFDSSAATSGYTFDSSGALQTQYSEDWYVTDYMPIGTGKFYELTGGTSTSIAYNVLYDSNKNVIDTIACTATKNFIASQDGYIRCSIHDLANFSLKETQVKQNVTRGVGEFVAIDDYSQYAIPLTCANTTTNVNVGTAMLYDDDYVDYGLQQRINHDNTIENVSIAIMPTATGSNVIDTSSSQKPEKVEAMYISAE